MRFVRRFLNRLENQPEQHDTVVVVDVLRSFTTAAVALARGARAVHLVAGATAAATLRRSLPRCLAVGAIAGGDPLPGFDCGNSPAQLLTYQLNGRDVVLCTTASVRGLQRFRHARVLYAASLVCARATAEAIRATGADEVCFVITGEWVDRDGDEDIACADYIEALLRGESPTAEDFTRRVRASDFGRRFGSATYPHLAAGDLQVASGVDRYAFAMPVQRQGEQLVIGG
ncbi:2-phosphosulfolactate phosphatase [Azonexus sp.]|jgi:2-phosphosulfolactate phosphatase|uniref:2-phosphosulfolactate phosphatase n=1 Tax=Azonexus sp. TaxID=1872668 RepID=UPI002816BD73|nr:2-phosphosulfolactate phosphatase [Azonexus sp.]MDR1995846.1 2-phosphosulfolactate phosphatase [Azonexus sp.]